MHGYESWPRSVRALYRLGVVAHAASEHVDQLKTDGYAARGDHEQQTAIYAEIAAAHAVEKVAAAAFVRSASEHLRRHLAGQHAPRTVPGPRTEPPLMWGRAWLEWVTRTNGGLWRALPVTTVEIPADVQGPQADHLFSVHRAARALEASRRAHRLREGLYSRWRNAAGAEVYGIEPHRNGDADQLHTDLFARWDRALAYGDAVTSLLRHTYDVLPGTAAR